MDNFNLFKEISSYISTCSLNNESKFRVIRIKQFICDLIAGKDVTAEKNDLLNKADAEFLKSSESMSDAELLIAVLQICDEETLISLENEFGKKSRITKIIREQIRKIPLQSRDSDDKITTSIENMLKESEKSGNALYSLICKYMMEKGFETDADFYNSISMSRQNFARIRNNSKTVGKHTIMWVIAGLKLDYHQAKEVLETAGYTFKNNDKKDVIVSYVIKNVENYDLDMINDILYRFGLPAFSDK